MDNENEGFLTLAVNVNMILPRPHPAHYLGAYCEWDGKVHGPSCSSRR